jgi:hypothetical protein
MARVRCWAAVLGIFILLALLLAFIFLPARHPGWLNPGADECRHAYARARSAVDTNMIDVMVPATGPQKGTTAAMCGLLRKSGEIRP